MRDKREPLKAGSIISHNGMSFCIGDLLGCGGNAMVYAAQYDDSLIAGRAHKCVIKELFPYCDDGGIYRGADGSIICSESSRYIFELGRKSFLHGNSVHLDIINSDPDSVGANFNSFEENNTLYSVLGLHSISTLRQVSRRFNSLLDIVKVIMKLLKAVEVFHKNKILHLDISPDNVIISPSNGEDRVLLIDFNSCGFADDNNYEYISVNPSYSAPELRLGRMGEISCAADIYSVCAVFVFLISGREFDCVINPVRIIERSELLRGIPKSAVSFLMLILAKGLRAQPGLRFQSVHEMLEMCSELCDRIDNVGITHGSIWEASRLMSGESEAELIDNNILAGEEKLLSCELFSIGNSVLTGEGGMGKTTLYKQLWYENTRHYKPAEPVYFFVPLYKCDGQEDFIKRYIVSKIKFGGGISTVADAIHRLEELMHSDRAFMNLMLDGFNEIPAKNAAVIREIRELGKMPAVTVSVSARADTLTGNYLKDFTNAVLLPLEREQVRQYLNSNHIAFPEDEEISGLLTNPLMLTLYTKAERVFQQNAEVRIISMTLEDIIHRYLESITEAYKLSAPDDGEGQLRLSYITDHLLPALCTESQKRAMIDDNTVQRICDKDYKRICSRAFSRAFRRYSGKSKQILGEAKNAEEWRSLAFDKILLSDTALIVKENDVYRPMHMSFSECLAADHKQNMKRYRSAVTGVRVPVTAAALTGGMVLSAAVYYYIPGTHPIGQSEIRNNYEIMTEVIHSVNNITRMTINEREVADRIGELGSEKGLELIGNTEAKLESMGSAEVSVSELEKKAYRGLDIERVEKLLSMSGQHRGFQRAMLDRMRIALEPSSIYTSEDIKNEADYYIEYLTAYEKLTAYELCLLTRSINDRGAKMIKDAMKGTGNIVMSFNNCLEMKSPDIENSIRSLELKLRDLEVKLSYIGGDI